MKAESRRSEMSRRRLLPLFVGTAIAAVAAAAAPGDTPRFDGEYGLWVRVEGDSVVVNWITTAIVPGRLVAGPAEEPFATVTTPAGYVHRAAFARTSDPAVLIRYGGDDGARPGATHLVLAEPTRPPVSFTGVDSLYVVGDTHGEFEALVGGLQRAGLIDADHRWSGGGKHLVFAGDLTDRGADVIRLLWFVYRLEQEAARDGGRVHLVLGNHEIMVLLGDLRYVHPKETTLADYYGVSYDRLFDTRESILGRWLASKPGMVRIDGVVIVHGGVAPEYAAMTLPGFDAIMAEYTAEDLFHRWADTTFLPVMDSATYMQREDFFWSPRSVFWHREYVQSDTASGQLDQALRYLDARLLVVGHTSVPEIQARYDGRVIAAHTPRMGAELLLLVRDGDGHRRYRVREGGPPQQF
ncbi:MAG TPA: metallophosphoesterase [Longimicrobiales bacterium]|nr:metallophosphoesterase [Longimicrobiales bacterium]